MSIDIKDIEVVGLRHAITSMRNPMNSWDESDSVTDGVTGLFTIGVKDHELAMKLVKAGTDHSKFMRDIQIKCQISAPLYWWKEMDTYKVSTVRNSCSTMHKILDHMFTTDDFSIDKMDVNTGAYKTMDDIISELNLLRDICIAHKDEEEIYKKNWYKLIQLLPSSYIQTSSWSGSYQTLRNIYSARKNHKLDEWRKFCDTIEYLPCSEFITCKSAKDEQIEKLKAENEELKKAKETLEDDSLRSGIQELNERNKLKKEIEELRREKADIYNENNKLKKRIENLKDLDALNKSIIRTIKEGIEDAIGHTHDEPTTEYTEDYVVRIVKEAVEKLKNKIEDLFDEQYTLNERIDDLKTSKINHLSEILDLKKKLKNSNTVDEILIEKTRKLLDMLKTKPESILIFDMGKVSNWSFNPGICHDDVKLTENEYVFQTNTPPYAFDKDDIEKILEADDTKKHNDEYMSYIMAFQAYNAKKRLNAMYGTACCHTYFEKDMRKFKSPTGLKVIVKTVGNDKKCCENCPKKGGEEE